MERARASGRVLAVRELMARAVIQPHLRSDGTVMLLEDESVDRFSGQQVFDGLSELLDVFEMTEPIEGVSRAELWGPSLVRPSRLTYISPWVLGGEPCVADSRVPTSAIYALRIERSLDTGRIHALYPELPEEAIEDAIELEGRLRAA
jgi:uncharacterized protein (DUF433 family)